MDVADLFIKRLGTAAPELAQKIKNVVGGAQAEIQFQTIDKRAASENAAGMTADDLKAQSLKLRLQVFFEPRPAGDQDISAFFDVHLLFSTLGRIFCQY